MRQFIILCALFGFALGFSVHGMFDKDPLHCFTSEQFAEILADEVEFQLALIISGDEYSPELHAPERKPVK